MNPTTPYWFYEIWVPKRAPYDTAAQWPTIVGELIGPIMAAHPGALFWFCQEGRWIQLCFAANNPNEVAATIRKVAKKKRFTVKRILRGTAGGALAGGRWLAPDLIGTPLEAERSLILLRLMNQVCRLYLHTLVKRGNQWSVEVNKDAQNPHKSLFESLMHLIANVSGASFDVLLDVRTPWMQEVKKVRVNCNL